jgi:hypothetical protein
MATTTPNLGLSLLATGESVGTWGIPLNNNFTKVDILAGEMVLARGSESDLNSRFNSIESEIGIARGVMPTLNNRLGVMLNTDGTINMTNFPTSTTVRVGAVFLSTPASNVNTPIAVGDNDVRLLTPVQKDDLTNGGTTTLHQHYLATGAIDVSATAGEINQAITGIGGSVSAANLTSLTNGSEVVSGLHTHPSGGFGVKGLNQLSVSPAGNPIAVGTNDPRMLTQVQHGQLTSGSVTSLHEHNLADGAKDLTVTAPQLNQFSGMASTVNASNLGQLTNGSDANTLHVHDNRYYTQTQSDSAISATQNYADAAVAAHNDSDAAHAGDNLNLGNITATSVNQSATGIAHTIRSHASDVDAQVKWEVKDRSGVSRIKATTAGKIECDEIVARISTVIENKVIQQDAVVTQNLKVDGNTILGDNASVDTLTLNVASATLNGDLILTGAHGIQLGAGGTVDGVDLSAMATTVVTQGNEVTASRQGQVNLLTNLGLKDTAITAVTNEVNTARGGQASLDARLDAMDVANSASDAEILNARGGAANLDARLDAYDANVIAQIGAVEATATTNKATATSELASAIGTLQATVTANATTASNADTAVTATVTANNLTATSDLTAAVSTLEGTATANATTAANASALVQSNLDTFTVRNDNPNAVTISQAVAADGGTNITVVQLENLTDGSNADGLHVHSGYDTLFTAAANSSVYGAHATIDARLETTEAVLNGHTSEITNARGAEASISARLDAADISVTNIQTASVKKYTETVGSTGTWTITHPLATKDVHVSIYDAADAKVAETAITSVTTTDDNTVTVVFAAPQAGRVVITG